MKQPLEHPPQFIDGDGFEDEFAAPDPLKDMAGRVFDRLADSATHGNRV